MKALKKIQFNSPVILSFVAISLISLALSYITKGYTNNLLFSVYKGSLTDPLYYIRLLGHIFGHANWAHFSGNIMFILLLGPLLEEKYGSKNILLVIITTAIVTGLINAIFFPYALLGASGVVFAFIILSSFTSVSEGQIPITFILIVIIYIGGEIISGITVKDNISNFTHIIGGIIGGITGHLLTRTNKFKNAAQEE